MSFQSLHHLLGTLEDQYQPKEQRQLQQLLQIWAEVVGSVVAAQAQPVAIQRGVLRVATSSSAWAQNLVFERQRILDKLNARFTSTLSDIRFAPTQWQNSSIASISSSAARQKQLWEEHPSRLPQPEKILRSEISSLPLTSTQAFQRWAQRVRSQSHNLPLCPHCHCPTPAGELERWHQCALCATRHWQKPD